ncbi:plastocyanin/azurin family copper-binding protein [Halorhabdus rudnickae]|uniref:plastocyanin/azurin family copper-binding protein n=1 Tax=Halorhabdus rudnickae TaxID=1775544 RepID=UPI001FCEABE4|nr:plastocyanin/azurin family copper-binding protein [Halorhabdus rudnickae]
MSEDEGAGKYVNTPAVVWLETGGTITWEIDGGSHSVTAYHPDNDRPRRIPENATTWDSGVLSDGKTFEHTFETAGVYNYYCLPHESLGMVGLVIVGQPGGGPGTTTPSSEKIAGTAQQKLSQLLDAAGISGQNDDAATYGWQDSTWDSYWYSLYNMSTNIAMSGNGVLFPHNEEQKKAFQERFPAMLEAADQKQPPVKNPNLNMAPFTKGDPHFTQKPVFDAGNGRPDASTLEWDLSKSSKVVSPKSLAWTHLKGVTWAKNFQSHFDVLPESIAPRFRSEVLSTLAQLGIKFSLADGNLRANDENMLLVGGWNPEKGVVNEGPRPLDHSAMLWFMGDMVSLAKGGWFGYENPKPLIPPKKIQQMADGVGKTVMNAFPPGKIVEAGSTRDLGEFLAAIGWYGTHAGNDDLRSKAADYANGLANAITDATDGNGKVGNGAANQAATQGIVGQGLVWASQIDGVDHTDQAETVLGYLVDSLWDADAGTFASSDGASTYTITARDAGDITGGLNAADAELGMGVKDIYAQYFNETFNHGRLQRAERPPSRDPEAEHPLPLPPKAGGQHGQAAVYNAEVQYDTGSGEWSVTDSTFDTEQALYLANQDIWVGQWGGEFFHGRGVPGKSDSPE